MKFASGTRLFIGWRMVSDPRKSVSREPRDFRSLAVKTCPLSGSLANCISSTAKNSLLIPSGIASTVQTQY